ncbi:hypothetical protein [Streptomyces flavofungini]|uniref:hypothetical protein n=1 Tax=Streptomyces flavofungini TaxID=68200 RepID=UPI0034DF6FC8
MSDTARGDADRQRQEAALAYVCGHLTEIRETLGEQGQEPLRRLEAALGSASGSALGADTAEEDLPAILDALHRALQRAGDAPGVYGYRHPFSAAGLSSLQITYRCPMQRCAGFSRREVTEFPPRCAISGRQLPRERLV